MNYECRFIIKLAEQFKYYEEKPEELFKALNSLSEKTLEEIYTEYGEGKRNFKPVNLLRAEIARQLLNKNPVSGEFVEDVKNIIRRRELKAFPHLPDEYLQQWANSEWGKKGDFFTSWKRDWTIFHTFFYRGEIKQQVRDYLNEICRQLLKELDLPDYKSKWFDFLGTQNFGATHCWLALTPKELVSHKDAYQFYLGFKDYLDAGLGVGSHLKEQWRDTEIKAESYEQALETLHDCRDEILSLNKQLLQPNETEKADVKTRKYFKFSPGERASQWEKFKREGIAALSFNNLPIRDLSEFSSREELNIAAGFPPDHASNETWNLWLFKDASIGDVVFASQGVNVCVGIGIIDGDYYYDETADGYQQRRKVRWITDKLYQYETGNPNLGYKTLFRFDTFSPTKVWQFILNEYARLYPELKEIFDAENLSYDTPQSVEAEIEINEVVYETEAAESYDFLTDADKPFISAEDFFQIVNLLKRKKNVILQGSPGVGKTFIARKIAYQIIKQKADSQIAMVQFHQSFAYEDFVQGLRLVKDGTQIKNGVFFNFCDFARKHSNQDFFFIIDEINRGNLSKIFGELMMLIEYDKREEKFALKLTYEEEHSKFFVPPNVHLIGTMNTADRSLAIVDYALRRRFAFFTLKPQFGADFQDFLQAKGISGNLINHICASITDLNKKISADINLGAGFQIGHSYFCDGKIGTDEKLWFQEILNFEIKPLLEEIWFDSSGQINEMIEKLAF